MTIFISSYILKEVARLATRIGVIHEGRLVKELDTKELAEEEEQRLVVDVRDTRAAQSALRKAGISARSNGKNSLVITGKPSIQHPEKIATVLVEAGCPPSRSVVEQGDLESYFLQLVRVKEGNQ